MKEYKGFIEPQIDSTHWILGASNTPIFPTLAEDGNWEMDYPSQGELQSKRGIETFNCTGFNTLKPIQAIIHRLTGERVNYSDRWLGIIAGTKEPGNDPHKVAEAIRKYGLIPEEMLPFSDDIQNVDEYYSFKGADKETCYRAGREWLAKYEFMHSWVFSPGQPILEQKNNMKIALKNSPLGIAVYAWASNEKDVYYSLGLESHWTSAYSEEEYLNIFDSYEPFKKKVDQSLRYVKRYSVILKKKDDLTEEQKQGFLAQIRKLLEWLGFLQKQVDALPKQPPVVLPEPPKPTEPTIVLPKYDWSNKLATRHSIRVICDEQGLSVVKKNIICAVIQAESGFDNSAVNQNRNGSGMITSSDWGICQINDFYQIGPNKPFSSIVDVVENPDKAVKFMIQMEKAGKLSLWSAYKNGSYTKYL